MTEADNKPKLKERTNQYQSARLYLRRKDHRDIVYNEKYHNAMCFIQEDDEKILDVVKWQKYKPHTLLGFIQTQSGYGGFVSIDVFNKVVHHANKTIGRMNVVTLKDYVVGFVVENNQSNRQMFISKDGHKFQEIDYPTQQWCPYGDTNSLAYLSLSGSTLSVKLATVQENEETEDIEVVDDGIIASRVFENIWYYYCYGRSDNGVVIFAGSYSDSNFYNVTESGFEEILRTSTADQTKPDLANSNRYTAYGNGVAIMPSKRVLEPSRNVFRVEILAYVLKSSGGKMVVIDHHSDHSNYSYGNCISDVIYKNGIWWYYYQQCLTEWDGYGGHTLHYRLRIFKSEDAENWEEVYVPTFVDIPIVETSIRYSRNGENPYKKLRLVMNLDASIPESENTYITNYRGMETKWGDRAENGLNFGTTLIDGRATDREQGICIAVGGNYYVVFKNMDFSESEDNFAFSRNAFIEYGEPVQEGDYCNP